MKKVLLGDIWADGKTSNYLAKIIYSAPLPLMSYTPGAEILLEGAYKFRMKIFLTPPPPKNGLGL